MIARTYYCPACKKRVLRLVARAQRFLESYCVTTGQVVRMRKSRAKRRCT